MLGSAILYLPGMMIMMFQLFGFYFQAFMGFRGFWAQVRVQHLRFRALESRA